MSLTIAAPPFIVQVFFMTKDGHGFSENYWCNQATYEAALAKAEELGGLLDVRATLFTASHYIAYVRVSDTTKRRDTLVRGYTATERQGTYVPAAGDTSPDSDALLIRWQGFVTGVPYFALRPLHLIPEECVTDGVYAPTVAFSTALVNLQTVLLAAPDYVMVAKVAGVPTSFEISSQTAIRMSRRKVGRPFGLSRGRSMRP